MIRSKMGTADDEIAPPVALSQFEKNAGWSKITSVLVMKIEFEKLDCIRKPASSYDAKMCPSHTSNFYDFMNSVTPDVAIKCGWNLGEREPTFQDCPIWMPENFFSAFYSGKLPFPDQLGKPLFGCQLIVAGSTS